MERAGKARDLARGGILMERALGGRLVQHSGRLAQFLCGIRVTGRDCLNGLFNGAVDAALYRSVVLAPFEVLTMALLG